MEQVKGVLRTLGDSTVHFSGDGTNYATLYGYIEIGDRILRKIQVIKGLDGKLSHALGDEITLYLKNGFVCGFTGADGRTFVTDNGVSNTHYPVWIFFLTVIGIISLPILVGLLPLSQAWRLNTLWQVRKAGMSLPNAIPI